MEALLKAKEPLSAEGSDRLRPKLSRLLVVSLLVGLAAWGSLTTLSHESGRVAALWPANGLLLAVLLLAPRRHWPAYLIGGYAARFVADALSGGLSLVASGLSLCNVVEILVAGLCIRKYSSRPFDLQQRKTLFSFVLFGVGVAPAISAVLAVCWFSVMSRNPSWNTLRDWYTADALGMALVTPCVWALQQEKLAELFRGRNLAPSAGALGLLALVTTLTFTQNSYPLLFVIFPFLLVVVFRLGFPGAAVGVFLVAIISVGFTVERHGPAMLISNSDPVHRIWILQIYLAAALVTALPFAALLEERKKLEKALQSSEELYRLLFEQAGEAIFLFRMTTAATPGTFEKVNDIACTQYGYSREELLRLGPLDLQAPENEVGWQEAFSTFKPGSREQFERIHVAKDGHRLPVEVSRHHIDIDGKAYGLSIVHDVTKRKRLEAEREELIKKLQQTLQEVKMLQGILPTCAYCKKIRDEGGAWHQFEIYIRERSEAEFSHGICPECVRTHFGKTGR